MTQNIENGSQRLAELRYLNERISAILKDETLRGVNAERKAIQFISFCGAGAAIVAACVIAMLRSPTSGAIVLFVWALIILLTKSTIFALRVIKPIVRSQEEPVALVNERATQDYATILQGDIDLWLSLYKDAVPVHNEKLFYFDRSVWNFGGAVIVALFATVLQMSIAFFTDAGEPSRKYINNVSMVVGIVTLVLAVKSDWLIKKIDNIWTVSRSNSLNLND